MTIYGWDMSHYDSPSIGNAIAQGIKFLTHKAGGDANDPEIAEWWKGVKGIDKDSCMLGAYWVLYPGNASARADAFISRLDDTCPGWRDRPFILQVDCEKWNGNSSTVPSIKDINSFCARLASKMPKLVPIAYAPKWVYGSTVSGLEYPLWASNYVSGSGSFLNLYPGDSSSRWDSYGGITPNILQYSSSATIGGQTTSDANAFRGSLNDLTKLLAPGWIMSDVPKKKHSLQTLDGLNLGIIRQGDDDGDFTGYYMVTRAQWLLCMKGHKVDTDGIYGPQTASAVKAMFGGDGKQIDLTEWIALMGLTADPTS